MGVFHGRHFLGAQTTTSPTLTEKSYAALSAAFYVSGKQRHSRRTSANASPGARLRSFTAQKLDAGALFGASTD